MCVCVCVCVCVCTKKIGGVNRADYKFFGTITVVLRSDVLERGIQTWTILIWWITWNYVTRMESWITESLLEYVTFKHAHNSLMEGAISTSSTAN